jgi:CBS domain-containing protein
VQPGLHALVGATAMLGGVFRSSISLVVIMVEGTGGIDFILPVILAIVISNWVAHHIHHAGAYEADLERLGEVCFLPSEPPHKLIAITAGDIMAPDVICFNEIVSVAEVVKVLRETQHNGFPVIRHTESDGCGQLVGLILRHQILLLLEQHALMEVDSQLLNRHLAPRMSSRQRVTKEQQFYEHAMRVYHHSHYPHRRYLSSRLEALDELDLDEILQEAAPSGANGNNDQHTEEANNPAKSNSARKTVLALDLRPYMNRAPLTVCTTAILVSLQTSSFHNFLPSPIPIAMSQLPSFIHFFIPILPFSFI